MLTPRWITDAFAVAPQLQAADFAAAAAAGFTGVINNRMDGEAYGQIPDAEARTLAAAAGLTYRHIPVGPEGLTPAVTAATAAAVEEAEGPLLAYCTSGTRSAAAWALAVVAAGGASPEEALAAIAAAGYALPGLRGYMTTAPDRG